MFITKKRLISGSWQFFERAVCRLLICEGYDNVRLVGGTGDKGADIIALKFGKRWLIQVKHWNNPIGTNTIQETIDSLNFYKAQIPVIVSLKGFEKAAYEYQQKLNLQGIPLQLWDSDKLLNKAAKIPDFLKSDRIPREYQETAIRNIIEPYINKNDRRSLIVLATGLGKTFVAGEAIRRLYVTSKPKILVLAHANDLIYQLEKAFWPFLKSNQTTLVWNGYEKPDEEDLNNTDIVFACIDSVGQYLKNKKILPDFDIITVDECHHAGSETYKRVLEYYSNDNNVFMLGLTATPWRPDENDIKKIFGEPRIQIDMVEGIKKGFLSNVDYRMHTDNINWAALKTIEGKSFSPKQINKTLFINQWDDAVINELQSAWKEQKTPRAIVFCGTIDHAIIMRDKINSLGFCSAAAIYSKSDKEEKTSLFERNRILCDFSDGLIDIVCTVDIFNEGIDVPDVNIIVFQRVTHSRRIFIQQLGRGLRISKNKEKLIVLDFVSDIRRFAAGLDLKNKLKDEIRLDLPYKVTFTKLGNEDKAAEQYLSNWLKDIGTIEDSDENASVLKLPPKLK